MNTKYYNIRFPCIRNFGRIGTIENERKKKDISGNTLL